MFRSPAPESPIAANNQNIWLQSFAELSPEDIKKRCQTYNKDKLENIITALEEVIELKKNIFYTFKNVVGYPSEEATINGINAYASGIIRESEKNLFGATNEEGLTDVEELATKYTTIAKIEPQLIAHLDLLKDALSKRFPQREDNHPSP